MFTQTVGDPGRGERVAAAVLADDAARAEVAAPITSTVMRSTGLPPEQQPFVAGQVDRVLQDPAGAQAFIDPFAGAWSRMLGEPDPRPARFDLAPLLPGIAADAGIAPPPGLAAQLPVVDVPLPRVELDWMRGVRRTISITIAPLAIVAAGLFVSAFLIGDRRRVLRRFGGWSVAAGGSWVIAPPLVVWAAGRWAPGADAVASAALDEATSGLLPVAIVLLVVGAAVFVAAPALAGSRRGEAPAPAPRQRRAAAPVSSTMSSAVSAQRSSARSSASRDRTATMPVTPTAAPRDGTNGTNGTNGDRPEADRPDGTDPLWDYYS